MATGSLYGNSSESIGLYGIGAASGGTYFEWFIFYDSATAPATPTGGSWSFTTNTGTTPTGWTVAPPASPTNLVWVSIAIVDSRSSASLTWSTPGLMTGSGLPVLTGSGVPSSGTGLNGQLYINTATTPQSMYNKQSGSWVQITGSTLYATAGANSNITSLTGLTGGISTPTFIQISTAGDGAQTTGKLQWDPTFGGPTIGMTGGNVNQTIGQDQFVYVYNNTGSTITKGQVVYISGSQGQRVTVGLAQANADSTTISVLGLAAESIANGASGFVASVGLVSNINTSGFADGAALWLSPTVPGGYTTTKTVAPNHLVLIGYVVKGGSVSGGSIYVFTQNGYELDELHDVLITSVANGNLLRYNSSIPAWVNVTGPTGTLVGTTDTQTLTNKTISGSSNTLTNIGNSSLTNSSVTINGSGISLGSSVTITAATPNNLIFGAGLSSTGNFNGSVTTNVTLANVGTAATYGDSGTIPVFTTNAFGQITSVSLQSVVVDSTDISGTIAIAQGGTGASSAANARVNLLPSYAGNAGEVLALNAGATDVEWRAISGTGTVSSVAVSGGTTGLTTSGGPITAAGTITLAGTLNVANGGTGVTSSTGTGSVVLSNSPTLVTPALGTPASGVVTNLTGTASININGTVGATTANTGAFTTLSASGNTILSNVNVLGASYDSVSFSVAGEELTPTDLFFSPDGLKMYVIGSTGDDVNEYNLSTAWVVSSAVFVTNFSVASQDTGPQGLFFRADGTKMYIIGQTNDTVFQYTLSTPWSVATASYDSISFSVAAEASPTGLWFKPNGLSMYMIGSTGDAVYQYTLSTAWNVSTATFLQSFSVSSQELVPNGVVFTGDGSRMFVIGQTGDDVNVYNLTTPWDISTSAFVNVFSVAGQDTFPQGIYIKPDGTKMYMVGSTTDAVYQYTVPSIDIQLTGPTSAAALAVQQDLTVYGNTTGSFLNNSFRENLGGQYYNLVSQADIGTAPNEIPLNQYLGKMAYKDVVGMNATLNPAPTIASAATIQPLTPIVFISGTTTINTITVPAEFVGGGQITLIPTGLWSTGTSGNIALATTGVVSKALIMTYDATTAKWYPSY